MTWARTSRSFPRARSDRRLGSPAARAAAAPEAAHGDTDAFGRIYDEHAAVAYALAYRILRDPDLAADAVQEAFLAVWRATARYDPERGSARTWVLMITHRKAVDALRRERRRFATTGLDPDAQAALRPEPDDIACATETGLHVARALDRLRPAHREILHLAYFEGLTQTEIADRLAIPLGTVKSRTYLALRRFRQALIDGGIDPRDLVSP